MGKCLANDRGEMKLIFVFLITLAVMAATVVGVIWLAYRQAEKEFYDSMSIAAQYERYPKKILYPEVDDPEYENRFMEADPQDPDEREIFKKVQKYLCGRELTDEEKKEAGYFSRWNLFRGYFLSSSDIFVKLPDGSFPWKEDELRLLFVVDVYQDNDIPEEERISYRRMPLIFHLDDPEIMAKHQEYQKKAVYAADMTYPGISMEMKQYYTILHSFYLDGNKIIPEEVWFVETRDFTAGEDYVSQGISEHKIELVEKIKRNVPNSDSMVRISSSLSEEDDLGADSGGFGIVYYSAESMEKTFSPFRVHIMGFHIYDSENQFHAEEKVKLIKKAEEIATEEGATYFIKEDGSDMRVDILSRKRNIPELGGDMLAVTLVKEPLFTSTYYLHSNAGFLGKILPGLLASKDCANSDSYHGSSAVKARKNETSILLLFGFAVVLSAGVTWVVGVRRKKKNKY